MTADFASLIWIERKTMDFVKDLKSEDKEIFDALCVPGDEFVPAIAGRRL